MNLSYSHLTVFLIALALFSGGLFYAVSDEGFPNLSVPTGFVAATVRVITPSELICNYTVNSGWNLISMPCLESEKPVQQALSSMYDLTEVYINVTNSTYFDNETNTTINVTILVLDNDSTCISSYKYESIHSYDNLDDLDHWKSYNPCLPDYVVQDLFDLEEEKGYFLSQRNTSRLLYYGRVALPVVINLYDGYNLLGYPANDTSKKSTIAAATEDINGSLISVHQYVGGSWQTYNATVQDFNSLVHNLGYWFVADNNDTWVIDW